MVRILLGTKIQKKTIQQRVFLMENCNFAARSSRDGLSRAFINVMQEESPGSIGCSASQSEGVRKDRIVQKKITAFYEVRVRRWGKSPPPQW